MHDAPQRTLGGERSASEHATGFAISAREQFGRVIDLQPVDMRGEDPGMAERALRSLERLADVSHLVLGSSGQGKTLAPLAEESLRHARILCEFARWFKTYAHTATCPFDGSKLTSPDWNYLSDPKLWGLFMPEALVGLDVLMYADAPERREILTQVLSMAISFFPHLNIATRQQTEWRPVPASVDTVTKFVEYVATLPTAPARTLGEWQPIAGLESHEVKLIVLNAVRLYDAAARTVDTRRIRDGAPIISTAAREAVMPLRVLGSGSAYSVVSAAHQNLTTRNGRDKALLAELLHMRSILAGSKERLQSVATAGTVLDALLAPATIG